MNLRSNKVDKRYLDATEREALNATNVEARQEQSEKRTRARRGAMAYQRNRRPNTTSQRPGTGGQSLGKGAQAARGRKASAELARAKSFRPEDPA